MDTKAAGRCVALGAMNQTYKAKAEAILDAAYRNGYGKLVEQNAREELGFVARHKDDKSAREGWAFAAIRACGQF